MLKNLTTPFLSCLRNSISSSVVVEHSIFMDIFLPSLHVVGVAQETIPKLLPKTKVETTCRTSLSRWLYTIALKDSVCYTHSVLIRDDY